MKYYHELLCLETAIIDLEANVELFRLATRGAESCYPLQVERGMSAMVDILVADKEKLSAKFDTLFNTIKEDTHEEPIQTKHPKRKK